MLLRTLRERNFNVDIEELLDHNLQGDYTHLLKLQSKIKELAKYFPETANVVIDECADDLIEYSLSFNNFSIVTLANNSDKKNNNKELYLIHLGGGYIWEDYNQLKRFTFKEVIKYLDDRSDLGDVTLNDI